MTKQFTFIGLSPGQVPFGREPLLRVEVDAHPFKEGAVVTLTAFTQAGWVLPDDEQAKVTQAFQDWNNSGVGDDNLLLLRR